MKCKATIALTLSLFSFSAMADGPKMLEEVRDKLNLPYIEFAKEWMKTSAMNKTFQLLDVLTGSGGAIFSRESENEITRTFTASSENQFDYAFSVFAEYCKANGFTFKHYKTDAYCVNTSDRAQARMKQLMRVTRGRDAIGGYQVREVSFLHQSQQLADNRYQALKTIEPGNNVATDYGSAMILERKDNGLVQIQLLNGATRWIRIDEIDLE